MGWWICSVIFCVLGNLFLLYSFSFPVCLALCHRYSQKETFPIFVEHGPLREYQTRNLEYVIHCHNSDTSRVKQISLINEPVEPRFDSFSRLAKILVTFYMKVLFEILFDIYFWESKILKGWVEWTIFMTESPQHLHSSVATALPVLIWFPVPFPSCQGEIGGHVN